MPRKLPASDLDHALDLYRSGYSFARSGAAVGVSGTCIERYAKKLGIPRRTPGEAHRLRSRREGIVLRREIGMPLDEIRERYIAGESAPEIAKRAGVNQTLIYKRLVMLGIPIRSRAAASTLIREQVATARAKTCAAPIGWGEDLLGRWLRERGKDPQHQRPEGTCNLDLALAPIAVEVWISATMPLHDPYCRRRVKYLSDRGWTSLYIHVSRRTRILLPCVADQIVTWHDAAERNPSTPRQHRVIRGCGDLAAVCGDNLDEITNIPPPEDCPHHTGGNTLPSR